MPRSANDRMRATRYRRIPEEQRTAEQRAFLAGYPSRAPRPRIITVRPEPQLELEHVRPPTSPAPPPPPDWPAPSSSPARPPIEDFEDADDVSFDDDDDARSSDDDDEPEEIDDAVFNMAASGILGLVGFIVKFFRPDRVVITPTTEEIEALGAKLKEIATKRIPGVEAIAGFNDVAAGMWSIARFTGRAMMAPSPAALPPASSPASSSSSSSTRAETPAPPAPRPAAAAASSPASSSAAADDDDELELDTP